VGPAVVVLQWWSCKASKTTKSRKEIPTAEIFVCKLIRSVADLQVGSIAEVERSIYDCKANSHRCTI